MESQRAENSDFSYGNEFNSFVVYNTLWKEVAMLINWCKGPENYKYTHL